MERNFPSKYQWNTHLTAPAIVVHTISGSVDFVGVRMRSLMQGRTAKSPLTIIRRAKGRLLVNGVLHN